MKKKNSLVTTGITSLFLIFCILCMVIFSLLSLGTSNSDLAMSKETMNITASYFDACSTASELCLKAEDSLWEIYSVSTDRDDYFQRIENISDNTFIWDKINHQYSIEIPFSESQALLICLDVLYPQTDDEKCLNIHSWKTILTGTWNPDNTQHIYQGD